MKLFNLSFWGKQKSVPIKIWISCELTCCNNKISKIYNLMKTAETAIGIEKGNREAVVGMLRQLLADVRPIL